MRAWSWIACGACALALGCGQTVPTIPPSGRDAGLECGQGDGGLGACPTGQVCLQSFCYARCSDTSPCGPLELCDEGVCVSIAGRDGGVPTDAGPPDPCEIAGCAAPTPYCRNGVCLGCETGPAELPVGCNETAPVCDVARGTCGASAAIPCGPCNSDFGCVGVGRCVARTATTERVCLPSCSDAAPCPSGFLCDAATMNCEPVLGTCTGMRASLDRRDCTAAADAECAPAGATSTTGLFTGACFDDGAGVPTCHQPCGVPTDCPGGLTCDTTSGFCL